MKLLSFIADGRTSFGAAEDNGVVDLGTRMTGCTTLRQLLETGGVAAAAKLVASTAPDHPLDRITFLPLIPDPGKIICVGLNYRDHVVETGRTVTEKPALFARFACSQVGHLRPIVKPKVSDDFDYEGELALVIGKQGRHIPADRALGHVAGYSCYNEGSVRDWQRHTSQFLSGKTFAESGSFGPWLVTADEIPDPSKLSLQTRLNGTVVQDTTTDLLITAIPELIAYISTICPLDPGDVIVTGTPGGVGARRTPPLWMRPGDIVEVEISGIGILRNTVIAEPA
ncbi:MULTISPECIES: fumarylacetoacetate hydrolase family protein [unclassified Bradyrhizobium]|uniref:fumarylacetoacetate hydrolase family protein n=1 Tax=unclassified Bradyrhizobium TaxID=2631580 RepID=UPI00211E79BE|nr:MULTISPECIES: fumarylacetoacetate hydrolase family protein [unclassified Bradyrhizobium]MDD1534325.1 5-carboxymethyl-2-hydroxymuconate isomerase [Bradyrhizobium sp. WBOS8]MDD1584046.1 5-carboxymethyl-2-hydroxymuconate isomerase [Bradyrhizobium sp. WBOS4]UUO49572.1 5-carboxymethyl-2-hydroxymuconate isomerase [Bradyrhizobium sp. WBOS04]UUO62251.1 5-carboxymethyl-2-hydroxymuconate isomerase [Bradyrhizobium sp. WBOS08]